MALADVVLGLVSVAPAHGYALHARLVRTLGRDVGLERSHVYAALHALLRAGLATVRDDAPAAAPARRQYAATPGGAAALRAWLDRPPSDGRSVLLRPLLAKAAVLELLGHVPSRRTMLAERRPRERTIEQCSRPTDDVLTRLLRERARRHAEVELWLLDQLRENRAQGARCATATARSPGPGSR